MKKFLCFFFLFASIFLGAEETAKPVIILDPGHGGKDEGAHIHKVMEKRLTLRTAYLVKKELEQLGYRVVMTRARDIYISLSSRAQVANRRAEALFVSLHYNSSASPSAKGVEIYYYGKGEGPRAQQSKKMASSVLKHLVRTTGCHSRGIKRGNFLVIRETEMPAVLIEGGFLTNHEERSLLTTPAYLEKLAKGVARGIDEFVN